MAKWKALADEHGIDVPYGNYRVDGNWYDPPRGFPYAFMDPRGFLMVRDEEEWRNLQNQGFIKFTKQVNVPQPYGNISRIPGYWLFTS